jgi:FixJ family two-component response regulator
MEIKAPRPPRAQKAGMINRASAATASSAIEAKKPMVIVIDDDQAVRGALTFALELEGFVVEAFGSGGEFLAEGAPPEGGCLVVDFNLPDMTGLELIDSLRRREMRLPAILITTHPSPSLRRLAAAAGLPIVEKPLLGDSLLEAIRNSVAVEERRVH